MSQNKLQDEIIMVSYVTNESIKLFNITVQDVHSRLLNKINFILKPISDKIESTGINIVSTIASLAKLDTSMADSYSDKVSETFFKAVSEYDDLYPKINEALKEENLTLDQYLDILSLYINMGEQA